MPEQLLAVLKICVLALLYLFFLRVLRVAWQESRLVSDEGDVRPAAPEVAFPVASIVNPAPAAPAVGSGPVVGARPTMLNIVAPDAFVGRTAALLDDNTIGRASTSTLPLDDTYVSQLHARVFYQGAHCMVEDLGSTNGTYLDSRRIVAPSIAHVGSRLEIGNFVMEFQ